MPDNLALTLTYKKILCFEKTGSSIEPFSFSRLYASTVEVKTRETTKTVSLRQFDLGVTVKQLRPRLYIQGR